MGTSPAGLLSQADPGRYLALVSDTEEQARAAADRVKQHPAEMRARDDLIRALYLERAQQDLTRNPSTAAIARTVGLGDSLVRYITRDLKTELERARAQRDARVD